MQTELCIFSQRTGVTFNFRLRWLRLSSALMWIVPKFDSSALLVMKAHQQNTWKPFIFKSLDFCQAIAVPQVPKASLLQSVEFDWLGKGQKRAQGIGSEGLL